MKAYRVTLANKHGGATILVRAASLAEVCASFESYVPSGWSLTVEVIV